MVFNPLQQIQQLFSSNTSVSAPSILPNQTANSNTVMSSRLAPVISIAHGGGPMPVLGDPSQRAITNSMRNRVPKILKLGTPDAPRAIVLVTAHWSTDKVTISKGEKPGLLYDYYGFPPESYQLKHNAPGSPEVAQLVEKALKEKGVPCRMDGTRDWDHGVFVPMILIDPKATTPIVQVSVLASESASESYAIGRALSSLRAQNIAIIGSGFATFHNLRLMFSSESSTPGFKKKNIEWSETVTDAAMTDDVEERGRKFEHWREWPHAWQMHPKGGAEHFLPLIVAAGAAGETKGKKYADEQRGLDMWTYYWDEE